MVKKLIGIMFFPLFLFGEEISFDVAIELAYKKNDELKILEKEIEALKIKARGNFLKLFYPSITANGNVSYQFFTNGENITKYSQGNKTIEITNTFPDNYTFSISIDKVFFKGFENYNSYNASLIELDLKQKEYRDKLKELWLSTLESYYKLLLFDSEIKISSKRLAILSNQLKEANEKYKLNLITFLEVNETNLNLKNENINYLKILNEYKKEEKNLKRILGLTDNLILTEELTNMKNYVSNITDIDKEKIFIEVLSNNFNYLSYNYSIKKEEINKSTLEWSKLPYVSGSFDYRTRFEKEEINKRSWQQNWQVGLSVSLPIDSLFPDSSVEVSIKQSKANIEKLKMEKSKYEKELKDEIFAYLDELNFYLESLKIMDEKLTISSENLNYIKKQFELGNINFIEFEIGELNYLEAKYQYENAFYNYYLTMAKIIRNL